jgi:hypothetical protein
MSKSDRIEHVIEGANLFTPEVIEILQRTYASAVGLLGGAYVNMPHGSYTKMEKKHLYLLRGLCLGRI